MKKIIYPIIFLFIFIPLGLISENPAWAEWDNEYYQELLGYIPEGIQNALHVKSFMPDYALEGVNDIIAYYASGLLGIVLIFGFFYIIGKKIAR